LKGGVLKNKVVKKKPGGGPLIEAPLLKEKNKKFEIEILGNLVGFFFQRGGPIARGEAKKTGNLFWANLKKKFAGAIPERGAGGAGPFLGFGWKAKGGVGGVFFLVVGGGGGADFFLEGVSVTLRAKLRAPKPTQVFFSFTEKGNNKGRGGLVCFFFPQFFLTKPPPRRLTGKKTGLGAVLWKKRKKKGR